jgi:hypothetical protein
MSIQDDIFDVIDALENTPEADQFDRIYTYLADLEREVDAFRQFRRSFEDLKRSIDRINSIEETQT